MSQQQESPRYFPFISAAGADAIQATDSGRM